MWFDHQKVSGEHIFSLKSYLCISVPQTPGHELISPDSKETRTRSGWKATTETRTNEGTIPGAYNIVSLIDVKVGPSPRNDDRFTQRSTVTRWSQDPANPLTFLGQLSRGVGGQMMRVI